MNVLRALYLMAGTALALSAILTVIGWPIPKLGYFMVCATGSIAWFGLDWYEREEMKAIGKRAGMHRAVKHAAPFLDEGHDQ